MNRNAHKEENSWCYFHPKQVVVGVCPSCLNERLLILAAKQDHHHHHRLHSSTQRKHSASIHKIFAFGSLFSRHQFKSHYYDHDDVSPSPEGKTLFYTLLLSNFIILCFLFFLCLYIYMSVSNTVSRKNAPTKFDYEPASNFDKIHLIDAEVDSFISIKFEENGVASWEKNTAISNNKVCVERQVLDKDTKSVIEHGKSNNAFRWRKRMGRLVQLIQWKRSNKGSVVGHGGNKVEGVKVRKGWMRTLTKRKTVE
ncbi:hypothetical protein VNO78_30907 [Psophocarpus tetragonolobus]|uniref:Transmembrane protein n=1 Tax=Psophocarpus tetragonolobus TaxID=3891 RepID=A0AAN9RYW7_PSOTE